MYRCTRDSNTAQDRGARYAPTFGVVHIALGVLLAVGAGASIAAEIAIGQGDCGAGVHLVARGATLSDVLKRLAARLDFQLELDAAGDSIVDADLSRPAPELVAGLSPNDSLIVLQAPDPSCPGRHRIVKVWLLARGNPSSSPPAAVLPGVRQTSGAEPKKASESEEIVKRAHGVAPASAN